MARVNTRKFTAKPTPEGKRTRLPLTTTPDGQPALKCGRGDLILKGETYYFFAVGFRGARQYRCKNHYPKPSELDGSLMSEVLAAQESATEALSNISWSEGDTADDIRQQVDDAIQEVKDAIESVADQYDEAAEAMGGSYAGGSQFIEWAETLRDAEIVNWEARDYDDPDTDEDARCDAHNLVEQDLPAEDGKGTIETMNDLEDAVANCDDCKEAQGADLTDWTADLVDEATDKVNDVSKE